MTWFFTPSLLSTTKQICACSSTLVPSVTVYGKMLSQWVDPESIESQYKVVWTSMALAQALTSNYTLSLLPCMVLLLANSLSATAWDVCELREFLLPFPFVTKDV